MFISDTHLPQLLPPRSYHDPQWYQQELEHVLIPGWHLVATTSQLPREGAFITFELLGRPVLLRRHGEEIRGFLNVCPHRLAKLSDRASGHCAVLKCGYHGWEFDEVSGATRKIPDAPSFRPLEKGMLGLRGIKVAVCGGLVFAALDPQAPDLAGPLAACGTQLERMTSSGGCLGIREVCLPVNWKVAVENTLESYHVAEVHPHTFGQAPLEQDCRHNLLADASTFEGPGDQRAWMYALEKSALARIGLPRSGVYRHAHLHPTCTIAQTDAFTIVLSFLPETATQTRLFMSWFAPQGGAGSGLWNGVLRRWGRLQAGFWLKVVGEDLVMLPRVQAGIASPEHAGDGLISRREERIVHYQAWLLKRLGKSQPEHRPSLKHSAGAPS